jgi:transcription initiation factor TFIIIB Brf1 subunit/transcription initiation factor TFIIB
MIGETMESTELILKAMKKAKTPLSAGQIAELTNIDRKEVDKAMKKLQTEAKIVSPKRCYWEPSK